PCWVSSTRARNARSVRHGQRQWLFFGRASLGSRLTLAPRDPSGLRSLIGQRLHYASCLKRIGDSITRAPCLKVMTVPGQRSQAAPIGLHRYLETLGAGQVLDDALAINGPHVDAVQEVNSRAHYRRRCLLRNRATPPRQKGISLGEVQNSGGC